MLNPEEVADFTLYAVIACWFGFAAVFLLRKRQPKTEEKQRDRASLFGIFFQGCAYGLVWFRPPHPRSFRLALPSVSAEIVLGIVAIALAASSVLLVMLAIRTLGKQWAVAARLVEGHQLITAGPYGFVRNPIYTGMLGMLVATGLALHHWIHLAIGIVLFFIGLVIRVRSEEKLLRSAFGEQFEDYARRVPAVLPGIY